MHPALARLLPFRDLRGWSRADLAPDLVAAAAVTVLSIPQGLAYALMAGLPPAVGLYASMLPAVIGGLFRSSRHVVAGPTNSLSLLVGGAVAAAAATTHAEPLALATTLALMVGAIQLTAGVFRLGAFVDYISNAVVLGYITGAAVLIAMGQLPYLTGTPMHGEDLVDRLPSWIAGLGGTQPLPLGIGLGTTALILVLRAWNRRIPGALAAMVLGIAADLVFDLHARGLRIIADIAPIPPSLPPLSLPSLAHLDVLVPAAAAATVLSLVESSSVARAIAARTGDRVDSSAEFAGQGLANLAAAFTGSYPVSGSIGRSVANWQSGARTRLAGPFGAGMVALTCLFAARVVDHTPLATLAGILLVLGLDLVDWRRIRTTMRGGLGDSAAFLVTLTGAWVLELDKAIYLGVVISIVLFLRRARLLTVAELGVDARGHLHEPHPADEGDGPSERLAHCSAVRILNVEGSLFFGAASELQSGLDGALDDASVRVLVLRLKRCQGLDLTTAEVLRSCAEAMRAQGRHLLLVGMRPPVLERMEALGLAATVGRENLFPTEPGWFVAMDHALQRALALVGEHEGECPLAGYLERREAT